MNENEIGKIVVDVSYKVHKHLGPGLLELVYEKVTLYELTKRGLMMENQVPIPIRYGNIEFEEGFRADIIVEDKVILELKSLEDVKPVHKKQLLTYLKLTDKRLGFIINFGAPLMKDGMFRIVNGLKDEKS